jgi:hypothetical protein
MIPKNWAHRAQERMRPAARLQQPVFKDDPDTKALVGQQELLISWEYPQEISLEGTLFSLRCRSFSFIVEGPIGY